MDENKAGTSTRGPMGGGRRTMHGGEKEKNFTGTFKQQRRSMGN